MKRIICFLIIFALIIASAYSSVTLNDNFKLFFSKDGVSTFYFDPAEVIAFQKAPESDVKTVAIAKFSVNWRLFLDEGFKLTLEACAENVDSEADNYCLMHSNGLIGLNYLMETDNATAGDDNNQNKLSRAARTIVIAENTGSATLPVEGKQDVTLRIPYPTYEGVVAVNGVYTGYLILTLTHN